MLEDIKSNQILDTIFQKMKNKRKLKIIKCSKKIINRLNITKDDFKAYETLKNLGYEVYDLGAYEKVTLEKE